MVLRRYALSIIALAILESGQWLKKKEEGFCPLLLFLCHLSQTRILVPKALLLSRREIRWRYTNRSYTMGYIPIGSSHIALFIIGHI